MALTDQIYFLILTGKQQTLHTVPSYVRPAGGMPQNFMSKVCYIILKGTITGVINPKPILFGLIN